MCGGPLMTALPLLYQLPYLLRGAAPAGCGAAALYRFIMWLHVCRHVCPDIWSHVWLDMGLIRA
jgi:hypothetical protein